MKDISHFLGHLLTVIITFLIVDAFMRQEQKRVDAELIRKDTQINNLYIEIYKLQESTNQKFIDNQETWMLHLKNQHGMRVK